MLFNYDECNACKRRRYNKKMVLSNVLPANVCDIIGDYVNDCWRCEWMKERERDFVNENSKMTKPELQLLFFKTFKKPLLNEIQLCSDRNGKQFKKESDRILDKQKVKEKYLNNKIDLQALKSYCKQGRHIIQTALWTYHDLKKFKNIYALNLSLIAYTYRNRDYQLKELLKWFLVEYVDDLIGTDKKYCDMEGIRKHIETLFD